MTEADIITKLVVGSQNGSENDFNELYLRTNNYVYNTIFNILKSVELSEDLVQETFLKLLQTKMKNEDNGLAYLLTIAKNYAINLYNRRKREVYINFDEEEKIYRNVDDDENQYSDINDLMSDNLTAMQVQLIKMHLYEGLTHKEIAKRLDKPIGTIMWQYNEALKALRKVAV